MEKLFKDMAEKMAITIRVMNLSIEGYENKRNCPFYSELKGIETALKTMGVDFEYAFDDYDVNTITAVTVMGHTVFI